MKYKLLIVYLFEFLRDGFYVGLFLLLPFFVKELHFNLFQAGSLQSLINILLIGLAIPLTYLMMRFGEIKLLIGALLIYGICFLALAFGHSYPFMFLIFAVFGLGFALYSLIGSHVRLTWFDKENRGKDLGNLMATGDVAKALFASSVGFFASLTGWRNTSFIIGIISCVAFLVVLNLVRKIPQNEEESIPLPDTSNFSFQYFLSHKQFLLTLIVEGLDDGVNTPFYAFLPFLLLYKGVPPFLLGIFSGFYYGGNIVSRLIFGRLVDKIGHAHILITLEIAMAVIIVLLILSPSLLLTGTLALILGFITEGTGPSTTAMVAESLEHIPNPQKASGIRMTFNGIMRTAYPFALGVFASIFGISGGFYILAGASLLPIIPAVMYLRQKDR